MFQDHLRIKSLVLGVITGGEFEGDEKVVPISLSKVIEITFFFWGVDFRVHLLLMILLTNFFYLVIYLTFPFLGVVPLVSVLLTSASG